MRVVHETRNAPQQIGSRFVKVPLRVQNRGDVAGDFEMIRLSGGLGLARPEGNGRPGSFAYRPVL